MQEHCIYIPYHLPSSANIREHWKASFNRSRKQKSLVNLLVRPSIDPSCPPTCVELIRVAPRRLDEDNLYYAFKTIRDQIASSIHPEKHAGRADDEKLIQFKYNQRQGIPKEYAIEVVLFYK